MRDRKGIYQEQKRTWTVSKATNLKLWIAVEAHFGDPGHKAFDTTLDILHRVYCWPEMSQEIEELTQACIYCNISQIREHILHAFSTAVNEEKPNEVIYADILYMKPVEENDLKYLLLTKDDISSYTGCSLAPVRTVKLQQTPFRHGSHT